MVIYFENILPFSLFSPILLTVADTVYQNDLSPASSYKPAVSIPL